MYFNEVKATVSQYKVEFSYTIGWKENTKIYIIICSLSLH